MSSPTVYFISGTNRGLGFEYASAYAARPNTVVYAGARDPEHATALQELANKHDGVIKIVKLSSTSVEEAQAAAALIEKEQGKIDVVIANAGFSKDNSPVASVPLEAVREHYETNALGPLILFQATHALLAKSDSGAPKFVLISSIAGSKGVNYDAPLTSYGSSKAAANFFLGMMHNEHAKDGLVVLAIHPGWTRTLSGTASAQKFGLEDAPDPLEDSVKGVVGLIDAAKREDKVAWLDFKGDVVPW
ncbi:short-chain dehydrogenase/reductase SDR family protein [Pseudohyphozyma bogoriensis]|nr:short-chain dehydrogenase/reductase SDR family protein [Pseudohyphozyma bogoriensis]